MKKFLLIILLFLPLFGNSQTIDYTPEYKETNKPDVKFTVSRDTMYNVDFVNALSEGMMDADFGEVGKFFADSILFVVESDSSANYVEKERMIALFDYILQNTILYGYEIQPMLSEDGVFIYQLNHYIVTRAEDGTAGLGLAIFTFSEKDGKIDIIYGL